MIVILVISTYKLPCWDSSLASIGGTAERKLHQLTYIRTNAYVLQGLKFVCGASNYINWRLRTSLNHKSLWMDEWVKSSIHKLHKMLAPNWFLYLKVPQLKSKFAPSRKLHPHSDHIINTHTKQVKTLCMDLSWDHFNSSLQAKTHIWPQILAVLAFKKNLTSPTKTNPKLSPVSENSTHLLQN